MKAEQRVRLGCMGLLASGVVIALLLTHEASFSWVTAGAAWCRDAGPVGMLAFAAADAACVVVGLPAILWTVLAGALWGVWPGAAVAFAGKWGGSAAVLAVVRLVGAERLRAAFASEAVEDVAAAAGRAGWRLALALRVAPLVPYNLLNYGIALSELPAWTACWTAAVGMLPGTVALVYAGAVAGDIAAGVRAAEDVHLDVRHVLWSIVALAASGLLLAAATRLVAAELRRGNIG